MTFPKTALRLMIPAIFLLMSLNSQAQDSEYSARLRIMQAGVEIRRVNTTEWLPLPLNAEAPLGTGDSLRTDGTGRALLTFLENVEVLILTETTVDIVTFQAANDHLQLALKVQGHVLQRTAAVTAFDGFRLEANSITVTKPAELLGVWAQTEELSVVTVAQGDAEISVGGVSYPVSQEQGIRTTPAAQVDVSSLEPPLSAARLIGLLDGCPGQTQTVNNQNVNVRVGPGFESTVIGSIPDEERVRVMGINSFGTWYRIQAFSGFGWMQVPLVVNNCADLPVLPGNTIERNIGIWNVTAFELDFLEPFYGAPEDDLWFYRSVLNEP